MGLMRFLVRTPDRIVDPDLKRVYIVGQDDLPFLGRAFLTGGVLNVERREDASGALCVPWMLDDHGPWMLTTTTLMERERPYQLEVELARGLIYRARDQLAGWQMLGLRPPEDLLKLLAEATTAFSRAAVMQADPPAAVAKALEAIALGVAATNRLAETYADQALEGRTAGGAKLPTLIGCRATGAPPTEKAAAKRTVEACNILAIACGWKDVEPTEARREWGAVDRQLDWARDNHLRTCLGPLLEFSDSRTPEWAYLFEGDADTLTSQMLGHVEACVKRYRGRVNLWNVAGQVNRGRSLGLADEQRLQLVARAVRRVREMDPDTPVTVSFDQPWGESMATDGADLATIEFADALERAELGIAGIGVQFDIGYLPHGSTPRSPLAVSRLLDLWSLRLDLPLLVMLTVPSGPSPDPHAEARVQIMGDAADAAHLTPQAQAEWVRNYLPVMLAKNCVQVVLWNQLSDRGPHELPHGGLIDGLGAVKPAMDVLREIRQTYLN